MAEFHSFTPIQVAPLIERPAAGEQGRPFFDTVGGDLYVDDGDQWVLITGQDSVTLAYLQEFFEDDNQWGSPVDHPSDTWGYVPGMDSGEITIPGGFDYLRLSVKTSYVYDTTSGTSATVEVYDLLSGKTRASWSHGLLSNNGIVEFNPSREIPIADINPSEMTMHLKVRQKRVLGSGNAFLVSNQAGGSGADEGSPVAFKVEVTR
jgi:hypothetical protein